MNEKSLLSQPAGMISKCKQTQAITIMKLIFDTDVKTNERHMGVATCMCETQLYAIAIHCHLFGESMSLYLQVYVFMGREVTVYTCDLQHD